MIGFEGGLRLTTLSGGTLSIDIGGSGIKGMVLDPNGEPLNEKERLETPRPANPQSVLTTIETLASMQPDFERVSIGFPGLVIDGVIITAPNLDGDWHGYRLADEVARVTARPVRVANDADMQGYGAIEGHGLEMVITLGTGFGSAVFTNGHLAANLELGHHPFRDGLTYEEYVGQAARKEVRNKVWNERVAAVIEQILPIWNPRMLYVGGGNAKKITFDLPERVSRVPNIAGILGGIRLWEFD